MTRLICTLTALSLVLPAAANASTPELEALFPLRAEIVAPGGKLARLVLPPEVVSACRPGLSDLRILDGDGREVPYFVDSGELPETTREVLRTERPEVVGASREEVAREGTPSLRRERYELEVPEGGPWELVIESRKPAFVRRVEVTDPGGAVLAEGSFFRLREPKRERLRLALPSSAAGRVTVLLEGDEPSYLEPDFHFETARTLAAAERAELELTPVSEDSEGGRTRLVVERPRGLVPDVLRLQTSTPAFHREVEVWDEGPGAEDDVLGRVTVFRVPALAPVDDLEIPLAPPRADRLRLVITNGDSPPLDDLTVLAVTRRPALVFSLPGEGDAQATLVYGGGRAWRPHYDLAGLLPRAAVLQGTDAEIGERLYDPALLAGAKLGETAPNPRFDPEPMLAFAHRAGSVFDTRRHRFRRNLDVEPSAEGLARLTLSLEDLAEARDDLADLRVVDGEDHQWAYLLERRADEETFNLSVSEPEVEDGTSRYHVYLPASPVVVSRLVLDTDVAFFDRDFELLGRRGKEEVRLARGRMARRIGDPRPVAIACPEEAIDELELRVQDGDDAPLPFTTIEGHFPVPAIYFAAPAGSYALVLGEPEATAPRYELERVRDLILAVPSADAKTSPLGENPAFSVRARLASDEGKQQVLLWVALGAAVVILTVLTLRLARGGGPSEG